MHVLTRLTSKDTVTSGRYFNNSQLQNRCEVEPFVYAIFDSEFSLELNPELVTLMTSICIQPEDGS
jgi:hypothetical protein